MEFPARFGRYELLDLLATGGMAEVFRARYAGQQGSLSRVLALKRVLPHLCRDEEFIRLFEKEIGLAMSLGHSNLIKIFDFGTVGKTYFMAMEYVHGKSLNLVVSHCVKNGVALPAAFSCFLVSETCKALAYAYELRDPVSGKWAGIIHRDISPHNIMLGYSGEVKLFDFGVAKYVAREKSTMGVVKGKPAYLSPEQARAEDLDGRTDVFSLGIVLWELLTGQRLFYADQALMAVKAVVEKPIVPPSSIVPGIPPGLDAIALKALERDKEQRYQSAREFGNELVAFLKSNGTEFNELKAAEFLQYAMADLIRDENAHLDGLKNLPPAPEDRSSDSTAVMPSEGSGAGIGPSAANLTASGRYTLSAPPPLPEPTVIMAPRESSFGFLKAVACIALGIGIQFFFPIESVLFDKGQKNALLAPSVPAVHSETALSSGNRAPAPGSENTQTPAPSADMAAPAAAPPPRLPAQAAAVPATPPAAAAAKGCTGGAHAVCALGLSGPTDYPSTCAAEEAHAPVMYHERCQAHLNPEASIVSMSLVGRPWRKSQGRQAARHGDELQLRLLTKNIPHFMHLQLVLTKASEKGGKELQSFMVSGNDAQVTLPERLGTTELSVELRALHPKGQVIFTKKFAQGFLVGGPDAMDKELIVIEPASMENYKKGRVPAEVVREIDESANREAIEAIMKQNSE